jgi:predicted branched-subunit amino acid permease
MSAVTPSSPSRPADQPSPQPAAATRAAAGIGVYAGVFGLAFGAVAVTAGLSVLQAVALSAVMFTGASQFALVGVLAVAGSPFAALAAALLLGVRNAFYGVPVTGIVRPRDRGLMVGVGAVVVALALVTVVPAGVPIIAAAGVAIAAGLPPLRQHREESESS